MSSFKKSFHGLRDTYVCFEFLDETYSIIKSLIESKQLTAVKTEAVESFGQFTIPLSIKSEEYNDIKIEYVTSGAHETDEILEPPKNESMLGNYADLFIEAGENTYDEYEFS